MNRCLWSTAGMALYFGLYSLFINYPYSAQRRYSEGEGLQYGIKYSFVHTIHKLFSQPISLVNCLGKK